MKGSVCTFFFANLLEIAKNILFTSYKVYVFDTTQFIFLIFIFSSVLIVLYKFRQKTRFCLLHLFKNIVPQKKLNIPQKVVFVIIRRILC